MNKAFIEKIHEKLLEEKGKVEGELSRFAHRVKTGGDVKFEAEYQDIGTGEDENAAEVANYSDNLSLESTLEKVLRDISSTLRRIEKGEYGVCKYCGKEIDEARLMARPTSSSCIACKKTLTQEV